MNKSSTSRMPFLMSADKAAVIIASGLARNKARITFPWQMAVLARVVINLPAFVLDRANKSRGLSPPEEQA